MRTRALMDYWQIDELLLGQIEHPGHPDQFYPKRILADNWQIGLAITWISLIMRILVIFIPLSLSLYQYNIPFFVFVKNHFFEIWLKF